jgi:hypothetical protein
MGFLTLVSRRRGGMHSHLVIIASPQASFRLGLSQVRSPQFIVAKYRYS